jgi:hypothetical protein
MTRKDYELIAKSLGKTATLLKLDSDNVVKMAEIVAADLQTTNARFDAHRFVEAVCNASYSEE